MVEAAVTEHPDLDTAGLGGHPRALTTLFFTELWERFSYYGMRAILVLYMVAPASEGGLGFDMKLSAQIYSTYTMLVYMSSIPGGYIADTFIGSKMAVLIGGIIIACGHFSMAIPSIYAFYAGLALIVMGTGLLKPNISTMLGSLYAPGDHRRDGGFSIFYMGINIGAAIAPIVCGFLAQSTEFKSMLTKWGLEATGSWHWGFAAAGVGMIFGLVQYLAHRERLRHVGLKPAERKQREPEMAVSGPLSKEEWLRLGAIGILFVFTLMFWAVYEQGGSSLNVFADKLTDCRMFGWQFPSSWLQSLSAIYIIFLAPIYSAMWLKLGDKEPSSPAKFTYGLIFLAVGIGLMIPASMLAATDKVSPLWLTFVYFFMCVGEMCLSPVGLSTVTKLAPARFVAMTMGVWYLAASLGNLLAGMLAAQFNMNSAQAMVSLFGGMTAAVLLGAVVLALLTPKCRQLMGGIK